MTCYKHYIRLSQHCGQQVLFALIQIKAGSELRAGINIVTLLALFQSWKSAWSQHYSHILNGLVFFTRIQVQSSKFLSVRL